MWKNVQHINAIYSWTSVELYMLCYACTKKKTSIYVVWSSDDDAYVAGGV